MRVRDLDTHCVLQKPNIVADGRGGEKLDATTPWVTVANIWASVKPASNRDLLNAQQLGQRMTHRVKIRYRSDVKTSWRLLADDGAMILEINYFEDPKRQRRKRELDLLCTVDSA